MPVHAYPPGTLSPPVIAVLPGDPYWEGPTLLGGVHRVTLRAYVVASNPRALDDLLDQVVAALIAAGLPPDSLPAPDTNADTGHLSAEVSVPIMWTH